MSFAPIDPLPSKVGCFSSVQSISVVMCFHMHMHSLLVCPVGSPNPEESIAVRVFLLAPGAENWTLDEDMIPGALAKPSCAGRDQLAQLL
jgi:hypothetical protein